MVQSLSRSAMTAFLFTLLATDAVYGGVVQAQRAGLPQNKDSISEKMKEQDSIESNKASVSSEHSETAELKLESSFLENWIEREDHAFWRRGKQESTDAALDAVGFIAASLATTIAKPLINNMPGYINNGLVGLTSVLHGVVTNASLVHNASLDKEPASNETTTSREARNFPVYGSDGVAHNAVAWHRNDEVEKADFDSEDSASFSSLRAPDPGRFTALEPILSAFGFFRRTIALQFMATMMVMTVAHLGRIVFMNLPQMLSIIGLRKEASREVEEAVEDVVPQDWPNSNIDYDLLREKAEHLAKQVVAAVTRDQCAERAACFVGAYCSQYSYTPSIMKLLRNPEPGMERPDHPVWLSFRDAAEGKVTSETCDQLYKC